MPKKIANKKVVNAFGWFKLERYQNLGLTSLDWYEQLCLRQIITRYIAPELCDPERPQPNDPSIAIAQACWEGLKRKPIGGANQLLKAHGLDLRQRSPDTLHMLMVVRPFSYNDHAMVSFCLEFTVRGQKRKEWAAYHLDTP
jgi:hypothetical protein